MRLKKMKKISLKLAFLLLALLIMLFFVACPAPTTFTITIDPTPQNGTIVLNPSDGPYDADTEVTVTAEPETGYRFSAWGGDLSGSTNPTTLTMTKNYTITATFVESVSYQLTVNANAGGSIITPATSPISVESGIATDIEAQADTGYVFAEWTTIDTGVSFDDVYASSTTVTLTEGDATITANFISDVTTYALTVTDDGNGSVTLNPAGGTYDAGTDVTLTPSPNTGYLFDSWTGTDSGDVVDNFDGTYTITMNADKTVSAIFGDKYTFAGSYDTTGSALGVDVVGNYAYIADGTNGLVILDITDPTNPTLVGSLDTAGNAYKVRVVGDYAYVADGNSSTDGDFKVIDITNPASPTLVDDIVLHDVSDVRIAGNYAYLANWSTGLAVIDVSDPANITEVASVDTDGAVVGIFVKDNYVYAGDGSMGMKIFDVTDPTNPTLVGTFATINYTRTINVIGNTAYLASGSHVEIVDVTNKTNPSLLGSYETTAWSVNAVGDFVYVGANDNRLVVLEASTLTAPVFDGDYDTTDIARDVLVSGAYIYVAASSQGLVIVNNPNTLTEYTLTVTDDGNGTVMVSPDGGVYYEGTTVTLTPVSDSGYKFDSWTGTNSADVTDNSNGTYSIVMNADKSVQATFAEDRYVLAATLTDHTNITSFAAFNPDGTQIVSTSYDDTIKVWNWDGTSATLAVTLTGHTGDVFSVAFNHNGTQIVSGSGDNTIKVWNWDGSNGTLAATLTGHTNTAHTVAFNHDGTQIVSGSYDSTIKVWNWDGSNGTLAATLTGHTSFVFLVEFNYNDTQILSGSGDSTIKVWNWDGSNGTLAATLTHTDQVVSVSFNHDGTQIVSGSYDNTIKVWDWDGSTGTVVATLTGHAGRVRTVDFNYDGTEIVSGGQDDNTIKVWSWDGSTGTVTDTLTAHTGFIYCLTFSPVASQFVSASGDQTVRVWKK
jgi:6-phosphogluconolactonase (cycloisomerase 2 family)